MPRMHSHEDQLFDEIVTNYRRPQITLLVAIGLFFVWCVVEIAGVSIFIPLLNRDLGGVLGWLAAALFGLSVLQYAYAYLHLRHLSMNSTR